MNNFIIVTRHKTLVEWLNKNGIYGEVIEQAKPEDIKGKELVNPAHPGLEGKILINEKDVNGKYLVQDYINAALKKGSAWVDYYWYKPGEVNPKHKYSFVRKVNYKRQTFIIGAGFYTDDAVGDKNVVRY